MQLFLFLNCIYIRNKKILKGSFSMTDTIYPRLNILSMTKYFADSLKFSIKHTISKDTSKEEVNQQAVRIIDTYGNNILQLAYSYLHNMSDAEEILQDTLIKYLEKTPQFENSTHEKAWLLKVASNLSKNRLDYNSIRNTDELNDNLIAKNKEDLSFIWEAVKTLPSMYREVIHLYYQEEYSTVEIAKILNRKESSVRSDLHRGRKKLKEILKEVYDFE